MMCLDYLLGKHSHKFLKKKPKIMFGHMKCCNVTRIAMLKITSSLESTALQAQASIISSSSLFSWGKKGAWPQDYLSCPQSSHSAISISPPIITDDALYALVAPAIREVHHMPSPTPTLLIARSNHEQINYCSHNTYRSVRIVVHLDYAAAHNNIPINLST